MKIIRYDSSMETQWNDFVASSKNGSFLLDRRYMDYHADRFQDSSLLFFNEKGNLRALLPLNWNEKTKIFYSHQGLTYGGLIMDEQTTATEVLTLLQEACRWMVQTCSAQYFIYKPIPYIYTQLPSEEDLYALFRCHANLSERKISSVILNQNRIKFGSLRRRGIRKAIKNNIVIHASDDWSGYWEILTQLLSQKYNTVPVHSPEEITLLKKRFPEQIHLYTAKKDATILGGCVIYETDKVAHVQYIAATDEGKSLGVLDALFNHLIEHEFNQKEYIDFGTSVEAGGNYLNEGLIFQKEGFGARAVMYDTYQIDLENWEQDFKSLK